MGLLQKKLPGGSAGDDENTSPMTMVRPDAQSVMADLEKAEAEKRKQETKERKKRDDACCFCGC